MPVLEETRYCKIENVGETGFKNNTRFARASKATVIENGFTSGCGTDSDGDDNGDDDDGDDDSGDGDMEWTYGW